jgi:hypothetical protein
VLFDQPWGVGAQDAGPHERPGDPGRAHHRPSGRGDLAAAVGPGDHLGGEQLLQAVQVALTRGGQEPLDQAMPLPGLRTKVGPQSRQPAARTAIDLAAVGLRQPGADVLLSLDPSGREPIQAQVGDHIGQPGRRRRDRRPIRAVPSQERVLDHLLSIQGRTQQPIGQPRTCAEAASRTRLPHPPPRAPACPSRPAASRLRPQSVGLGGLPSPSSSSAGSPRREPAPSRAKSGVLRRTSQPRTNWSDRVEPNCNPSANHPHRSLHRMPTGAPSKIAGAHCSPVRPCVGPISTRKASS